jgi:hypothetical protein
MTHLIHFNGLDAETGGYLLPPMPVERLAALARGNPLDPDELADLRVRAEARLSFGLSEGRDPRDLSQSGWGIVLPACEPNSEQHHRQTDILEALRPLIEHRRTRATAEDPRHFRVFSGEDGLRPGESKQAFLARHGAGPGPVDPWKVPYYLLLVGDPTELPFAVQTQLDVQHAVGRLHFDALEDYARYAASVLAVELGAAPAREGLHLFGVANPGDRATEASARGLIDPLGTWVRERRPEWALGIDLGESATKARLREVLGQPAGPALLFTASHGASFGRTNPDQRRHQGALVCQDWTGPEAWGRRPLTPEVLFGADDLPQTDLRGLIAFFFACFGAGTPRHDGFTRDLLGHRPQLAEQAFVSELPRRLLCHPPGGALAVIGHVDRAWTTSFLWSDSASEHNPDGQQLATFRSTLVSLMKGYPVGAALEHLNQRYAELSTALTHALELEGSGPDAPQLDAHELSALWTANNDARGYVILGDPAVRLGPVPVREQAAPAPIPAVQPAPQVATALFAEFGLGPPTPETTAVVEPHLLRVTTRVEGRELAITTVDRDGRVNLELHTPELAPSAWQKHQETLALVLERWLADRPTKT